MRDLNDLPLSELFRTLMEDVSFTRGLDAALKEDLGDDGDVTTRSIIDPATQAAGRLVARDHGVLCGMELVPHLLHRFGDDPALQPEAADGSPVAAGQCLGVLGGSLVNMLALERTLLNYLGHLSGVATLTQQYVEAITGTGAVICDTRKTTPGLRRLEKYAVRCGGGFMHRQGLFDAALYKDNHLVPAGVSFLADVLVRAVEKARADRDLGFVEVEVDTIEQLEQVLSLPEGYVDMVLLDNMPHGDLRRSVALRDERRPAIKLEASGGVTMHTLRDIADTGVDRISIGALTHSASCLDIGLDLEP